MEWYYAMSYAVTGGCEEMMAREMSFHDFDSM
jgi:hypothetical protein